MSRSVHEVLQSKNCRVPTCTKEADTDSALTGALCRFHAEQTMKERLPSIVEDLWEREEEAQDRHGRRWTREEIIKAIQDYAAAHGRAPTSDEWKEQAWPWPNYKTVRRHFGSWANAIEAAELPRPAQGVWVIADRSQPRGPYLKKEKPVLKEEITPTPDAWLDWSEGDRLRLEYIALLLTRLENTEIYHSETALMDRIERLLWGNASGPLLARKAEPE